VHEGGFEVRGRAPDALTFFTPAGIELKGRPDPAPSRADPVAALKALHTAEGLEIKPETNIIWWQGERWDLSWAVESLQSYKEEQRGPA
jgi:hypothetical protein